MRIRDYSIKLRVLSFQLIIVALIAFLVGLLWFQQSTMHGAMNVEVTVNQLENSMLQLRRHEKDFLLRRDLKYKVLHDKEFKRFTNLFTQLVTATKKLGVYKEDFNAIEEQAVHYQSNFQKLVELEQLLGLTFNDGLRKKLGALWQSYAFDHNEEVKTLLVQTLISAEKFVVFPSDTTLSTLLTNIDVLKKSTGKSLPPSFIQTLTILVDVLKERGLNQNLGVEGEMRRYIHEVEEAFALLLAKLKPVLAKKIERSYILTFTLAGFIALSTILLLVSLGRSIISPINRIISEIKALKAGQRDIVFEEKDDEIGQVTAALSSFQESLIRLDTLRDAEKRYQNQLLDEKKKLETALDDIKQMQSQLVQSEKLASLGSLVAGVSHEINTPLGIAVTIGSSVQQLVTHFVEQLQAGKVKKSDVSAFKSEIEENLNVLLPSLERAANLIHSFKQVAIDQTSEVRRVFKLSEMVEELMLTLQHQVKNLPITLRCDIDQKIEMDSFPGPLGQVITNLFNNAIIHAFEPDKSGTISISAKQHGATVIITVEDDGKGIKAEHLDKIFDPFFTTKLGQGGSGLGLSVIYNIVSGLLKGKVTVKSNIDHGTCFELTIPLTIEA